MKMIKKSILFALVLAFGGCGNNSEDPIFVDAEVVKLSAMKINDLTIQTQKNTFETTNKLFNDIDNILASVDKVNQSVMDSLDLNMKLANTLAKPFKISDNYSTIFGVDNNYTSTIPPFVVKQPLVKKYFLLASQSKFFLDRKTIKIYFYDAASLTNGWIRVFNDANKDKDLYLCLSELDDNNTVTKITNSFMIPSATLKNLSL
jgi:hypothetical protein